MAILSVKSINSCDLHTNHQEVERHNLEQILFVLAEEHQSYRLAVYEEPEVALIGIQGASEGLVSGFQFNLNKKETIRHYLNVLDTDIYSSGENKQVEMW